MKEMLPKCDNLLFLLLSERHEGMTAYQCKTWVLYTNTWERVKCVGEKEEPQSSQGCRSPLCAEKTVSQSAPPSGHSPLSCSNQLGCRATIGNVKSRRKESEKN